MTQSWWRRNRLWLLLLVPLLALAVAASSFRLITLYLPWEWSSPIRAGASAGTLTQVYMELDGQRYTREVHVEVLSVTQFQELRGAKAVDGAALWRVLLELSAEPDQFLSGCEVELLDADGNRYDFRSSLEAAEEGGFFLAPILIGCVPEDASGPTVEPLTGEVINSRVERPGTWREEVLIAVPEGVQPAGVRIAWSMPVYLELEVP